MNIITELVSMKLGDNTTKEEFFSIVDNLERNFHSKQPGFIDSELLYDEENNLWIMIQHWKSITQLKEASDKMFKDSSAESFVDSLNSESVKMTIAPQIELWGLDYETI